MIPKRALCIHDMSAIGRCSLSVISPVLASMGIQPVNLPTAVLSAHFGGFGPVAMTDLSDFCEEAISHYRRIGETFDCVYSGFLSSPRQTRMVKSAFRLTREGFKLCDPAMADNGRLYSSVTKELADAFKDLCAESDLIIPNPTEAAILLDRDYTDPSPMSAKNARNTAAALAERYCDVIITGTKLDDGTVARVGCVKEEGEPFFIPLNYLPVSYPGTGDLFGGCMAGFMLKGYSLKESCEKSARFVEKCVKLTFESGQETKYGVHLEPLLKELADS